MEHRSRREFMQLTASGFAGLSLLIADKIATANIGQATEAKRNRLTLGMASYTFRKFKLDDCLSMTSRLGLKKIAFKDFHLSLDSSTEEIKAVAQKVKDAGLDLYGCGVVYMKNEAEVEQAFNYAKTAGMQIIIGVPDHHLLKLVNEKVKQNDIKLAIHNHGPGDERYPSPQSAYDRIKNLDPRIGLCMDVGHTKRIGLEPSVEAKRFKDRLLDIHVKDVSAASKEGKTVEIGRGVIDIPTFLKTLIKINYQGSVSLEFEKDAEDPLAGAAESIGYLRGVLSVI